MVSYVQYFLKSVGVGIFNIKGASVKRVGSNKEGGNQTPTAHYAGRYTMF